jgi:hypothetical protein
MRYGNLTVHEKNGGTNGYRLYVENKKESLMRSFHAEEDFILFTTEDSNTILACFQDGTSSDIFSETPEVTYAFSDKYLFRATVMDKDGFVDAVGIKTIADLVRRSGLPINDTNLDWVHVTNGEYDFSETYVSGNWFITGPHFGDTVKYYNYMEEARGSRREPSETNGVAWNFSISKDGYVFQSFRVHYQTYFEILDPFIEKTYNSLAKKEGSTVKFIYSSVRDGDKVTSVYLLGNKILFVYVGPTTKYTDEIDEDGYRIEHKEIIPGEMKLVNLENKEEVIIKLKTYEINSDAKISELPPCFIFDKNHMILIEDLEREANYFRRRSAAVGLKDVDIIPDSVKRHIIRKL